jgi:hypothetical protein
LLARLSRWVEERAERGGLRAVSIGKPALPIRAEEQPRAADKAPAEFGAAPVGQTEYFVSYAWGDDASP